MILSRTNDGDLNTSIISSTGHGSSREMEKTWNGKKKKGTKNEREREKVRERERERDLRRNRDREREIERERERDRDIYGETETGRER